MSDEQRVYRLSNEHYEWADVEDLAAEPPNPPAELLPFFVTGDTVADVDDLHIYGFGEAPHFAESDEAVEATPQEVAQWRSAYADVARAQEAFRERLGAAQKAYKAACQEALAELAEATRPWQPVEAELKSRTAALAAKLREHRDSAKEWKAEQEARRQEHLDAVEGPRALALYKPVSLSSRRQADHIARVHLETCKRRAKLPVPMGHARHADEGLRANEAWHRLSNPNEWIQSSWGDLGENMRVKFCTFCKPWTVFQEHIDDFPWPLFDGRMNAWVGEVRLTEIPEAWTESSKKD